MRLFIGTSGGLVLYEDGEVTRLGSEPVSCLLRNGAGVLVGTAVGSIMRWEGPSAQRVLTKDLGEAVTALCAAGSSELVAGTHPAGLWRSRDGGESWNSVASLDSAPGRGEWTAPWGVPVVSALATHPKQARTIYLGIEVGGVYRSRDGGKEWFDLAIPGVDVHSIQISPARYERVYVTTGSPGEGSAFCSNDEGFTWRPMGTANQKQYTMGLAAHPSEVDRVIVSAAAGPPPTWKGRSGAKCDVYLSTDAGRRFRTVVKDLKGGVRRKALVINPKVPSEVAFGTSDGDLWYSSDGGESFDRVGEALGDVFAVAFA